jgi:hypothetical protein
MNRRTALKHVALTGMAAIMLPQCVADPKKVSVALENLHITADDEELMAEFADTLIPATDKPGAKLTGAHLFAFVMVDECLPADQKEMFMKGLNTFRQSRYAPGEKKFMNASPDERLAIIEKLDAESSLLVEPVETFYTLARRFIIQGYTTSQYFLTEVKPYKHIPGPVYKGCIPLSKNI